jgi:hypothetical protein
MTCSNSCTPDIRTTIANTQAQAPNFYKLLPEFMRVADAAQGSPLCALLASAQQQANLVDADITVLWQNFFVETCEDWVLPYIADLIDLTLIDDVAANNRRDVARTIAYRRRKGTVPQLETMANDITGWGVHVAEFFHNLHWTQNMIHFRKQDKWTVDVRDKKTLPRLGSAFDTATYTADFRPATETQGRYNIRNLGFFCYRLEAIPLTGIPAAAAPGPAPAGAFHFDVLGQPEPLFVSPAPLERPADAAWPRVTEDNVIRALPPYRFREAPNLFWQTSAGFNVFDHTGAPVTLTAVPADLCSWTATVTNTQIAIDVRLGRFLVTSATATELGAITTNCFRGLASPIGGGGYDRSAYLSPPAADVAATTFLSVAQSGAGGAYTTIDAALTAAAAITTLWIVIQIQDSAVYTESLTLPAAFTNLAIQAVSGARPTIVVKAVEPVFAGTPSGTQLILSGLLFTGAGQTFTLPGSIASIQFLDCTIDPGGGLSSDGVTARPAGLTTQVARASAGGTVSFTRCIVGPIDANPSADPSKNLDCLSLTDSIVDAQAFPAGALAVTHAPNVIVLRCTISGRVDCQILEASLSIFDGIVRVQFRQQGCVRFCYFAPQSRTPRRYECAPALPRPVYTSSHFGDPGYFQLAQDAQPALLEGERGYEIGVWSSLRNAQRQAHLELRLQDYMPAGLVPEIILAS